MAFDFVIKNKIEYERMKNIITTLTQIQWELRIDDNWTVGNLLCHIAFWDKMTYERLYTWKMTGNLASLPDPVSVDAVNASVQALSDILSKDNAVAYILRNAEQVDNFVATLSAEDVRFLKDSGRERWYMRYEHRALHLDNIQKTLKIVSAVN